MKGILFKPWKIKAIADSSPEFEWQTRRLAGLKEINQEPGDFACNGWAGSWGGFAFDNEHSPIKTYIIKPRYQVGDVVYIKETHYAFGCWEHLEEGWVFSKDPDMKVVVDDADWKHALKGHNSKQGWYKRSPMFMFATDARYFVRITGVRPERLTLPLPPEDLIAEGGAQALEILSQQVGKWHFVYSFKKVNHKEE